MNTNGSRTALAMATVMVLSVVAGGAALGAARTGDLGDVATVDATPTDPNEAESTHAVVVPLGSEAESPGSPFNDVVVDYTVDSPEADVSNVGAGTVERVGIDRDGDDVGSRVDVRATVTTVSGKKDGGAVRIATSGDYTLQQGDEVVVVLRPVQNPQTSGTADVQVTVNSQSAADRATGTVTYEYNDASVTFEDQSTAGGSVTLSSVTLSEAGFVAIQNASGARSDEIRGHSAYLSAGTHEDVTVRLDVPLERDRELVAQAYTDANANRRFQYDVSGGDEDFPYRNRDGNLMGTDTAQVTLDSDGTPTPTPTPTDTPTPTATPSDGGDGGDGGGGDTTPTASPTPTPTPTATPSDGGGGGDGGGSDTTPTASPTPTGTADGTPTTDSPTATDRAGVDTPTATPTPVTDGTPTPTATETASPSPTATEVPTITETPMEGTDGDTGDGTETDGQPGFGVAVALLALVAAALLARRA